MVSREPTSRDVLEQNGHRLVRAVMAQDGPVRDALIDVAARTGEWTPDDWDQMLAGLDGCRLKISTWLAKQ